MLRIVIGSKSEIKFRAVDAALGVLNETSSIEKIEVESGVSAQPFGFEEIIRGATARALGAYAHDREAIGIGIESGIISNAHMVSPEFPMSGIQFFSLPCVVLASKRGAPFLSIGTSLPIPYWMIEKVQTEKTELGHIVQAVSGGVEKNPHRWLSGGVLSRDEVMKQAVISAFLPVLDREGKYKGRP